MRKCVVEIAVYFESLPEVHIQLKKKKNLLNIQIHRLFLLERLAQINLSILHCIQSCRRLN